MPIAIPAIADNKKAKVAANQLKSSNATFIKAIDICITFNNKNPIFNPSLPNRIYKKPY